MRIISLGWGVQSFTLAAMAALGEIESVDYAIHADTGFESNGTYRFAKTHTTWLEQHGVRVITVENDSGLFIRGGLAIPAFSNEGGMIRRQCTYGWKIRPIRQWLQAHRDGQHVNMLIGISLDEYQRQKPADVKYISNQWPLIERRMTRNECKLWLSSHGLEEPPKSSCYFCPFHDDRRWREMKMTDESDWDNAVQTDEIIRNSLKSGEVFLHRTRKPLIEVDFSSEQDRGQMSLFDDECTGICGV